MRCSELNVTFSILVCNEDILGLSICDGLVSITLFAEQGFHVSATIYIGRVSTPSLRYKREGTGIVFLNFKL